jgi:hypothetical protein
MWVQLAQRAQRVRKVPQAQPAPRVPRFMAPRVLLAAQAERVLKAWRVMKA